ncbi:MAG: DUF4406 domain-containing protein [Bacteroidia bacterium]|nr:DUF4406 domain-containing protein [Bacteroidia bacterium]
MQQLAYISGKITGLKDLNKPKFAAAEKLLKKLGYKTVNPHKLCSDIHPDAAHTTFMKRCLAEVPKCDLVVVLDDWHNSVGAQDEVELAINLKLPVLEIETMEPVPFKCTTMMTYKGAILNVRLR